MVSLPHIRLLQRVSALLILAALAVEMEAQRDHPDAPSIDTVYILPSSHWDFGFIRTPEDEQAQMKPHLDSVLDACKRNESFRWTIESIWQLSAWLDRTHDETKVEEMRARIASGQIEVSASWGSMHTEFMGTEELNRLEDESRRLAARFGLRGDMAMEDDVPGFSLRLPQVLARSGVRYLVNGSNTFIGGGTSLSPRVTPFFWASPDGSRVLTWTTRSKEGGYTEGLADYYLDPEALDPYLKTPFYPAEWKGLSNEEITARGVKKLVTHYADAGYAGHTIAVLFMHDGIGPEYEESLLKNVERWNSSGHLPHLRVATPHEYFSSFTPQEMASFPTYSGDWSGLWSESKTNSPAMSADARFTQEALPLAEEAASLANLNGSLQSPSDEMFRSSLINLLRYDEHNGAGNAGWPKVLTEAEVNRSNLEYATYIRDGRSRVERVLDVSLPALVQTRHDSSNARYLIVSNLRSWPRTDVVEAEIPAGSFVVRDSRSHELVPAQHLASGSIRFLATDIPPSGYKSYILEQSAKPQETSLSDGVGHIENERYVVDVDSANGKILRIFDKKTSQNFFDKITPSVVRSGEVSESTDPVRLMRTRDAVEDNITIVRSDTWWAKTVISLPHRLNEVRIEEDLDRAHMPLVAYGQQADRYTISFPFKDEGNIQKWIDDGIGFHCTPQDSLPGSRLDGVVPRFLIALEHSGKAYNSVLFAQQESFFAVTAKSTTDIEVRALLKGDQGDTKDHGVVAFKTFELGYSSIYPFHFRFRRDEGALDPVAAYRFGREAIVPLKTFLLPPHTAPRAAEQTFLSVSAPNVVIEDLREDNNSCPDCYLLRLQEIAGIDTSTSFATPNHQFEAVQTDLTGTEAEGPVDLARLHLGAHETATFRLRRVH
jgi:hypothetical protein